jgi:glycosyltransferase involved in cell wall biosynthesis
MKSDNILVISNDKLFLKDDRVSSNFNDTINIIGALIGFKSISFLSRFSKKDNNFSITNKKKNFLKFPLFDFFKIQKYKILMISITPFNFLTFLIIKTLNKKVNGYVYLRSDGHLEYFYKYGTIGLIFYKVIFNYITNYLAIISVSKHLTGLKNKYFLINPSEIEAIWYKKRTTPKLNFPRLLYLGRFKKEKGVFSLLKIVKLINNNFRLNIVGSKKIISIGKKINLYDETSSLKKIIKFYDNCNIFVLPSYTEGAPKVILESLARYRPIIVFSEIKHVKSKFKGIFVSKRNYKNFKKKIDFIINNYQKIINDIKKNKIPSKSQFQKKLRKIIL